MRRLSSVYDGRPLVKDFGPKRFGSKKIALFLCAVLSVAILIDPMVGPSAQGISVPSFRASTVIGGGGTIRSQAAADFNSDGIPDVLMTDVEANSLRLFLGNGDGSFASTPVIIPNVQNPHSIALSDVNNDGAMDIVVAADNGGGFNKGVLVILGTGNATFGTRMSYATGFAPFTVLTDDFNGDRKSDFVIYDNSDFNLKVYFGNGDGTHVLNATYPNIRGLILTGDFNGDGKPEIIARRSTVSPITMLANNGDGTFAAPATIPTGTITSPQTVVSGDFNGDSRLDLFVTSIFNSNNMVPLFGNGNNTFTAGTAASFNANLGESSSGDFNRDQKTDLATRDGRGRLLIFPGNSNGTFGSPATYSSGGGLPLVTDLNRDHWPDLIVAVPEATAGVDNLAVMLNRRDGSFFAAPFFPLGFATRGMVLADFNSDQLPDVAIASSPGVGPGQVIYALQNASGGLNGAVTRAVPIIPLAVAAADFNNDGLMDVAAGGFGDGSNPQNFAFLSGTGSGLSTPAVSQLGSGINAMVAVDFNADTNVDLGLATSSGFMTALGNGNGTFNTPVVYPTDLSLTSITSGDFNNDGKPDFAAVKSQTGEVVIFINAGAGTFISGTSLSTSMFGLSIGSADFDGDSNLDVLVATDSTGLYIFRGNGDGSFQEPYTYPIKVNRTVIADFNQDGRPDVACINVAGIPVLINDGTGHFTGERIWSAGTPMSLAATDFNRDQKQDIIVGGFDPANISLLINGSNTFVRPPRPSRSDFDGDGKSDLSVFRPSDGNWYVFKSGGGGTLVRNWGIAGDVLTPGDYDGDGKADTAAYRPSSGQWLIFRSSDSTVNILNFGIAGDRPVAGDYDGDGKTDVAQFRPSEGVWYVFRSSDNGVSITTWGEATDLTVPADYDGDGKTDVAVFRPSTGVWYVFRSTAGPMVVGWGVAGDKPVEADYDGDGKDDVAIYRPSEGNWYVFQSSDNTPLIVNWGNATDVPSPGDYDGDGKDDFAVFRDGTWFAYESTAGPVVSTWGMAGDTSIPTKYLP